MKILTLNFLTCAITACKSNTKSFPLHPQDAELESVELDFSPTFLRNILPRLEWAAMVSVCTELGLALPSAFADFAGQVNASTGAETEGENKSTNAMEGVEGEAAPVNVSALSSDSQNITDEDLKALHEILIETQMVTGKLVCGNCGHEYAIKEGIANFLLPPHLV